MISIITIGKKHENWVCQGIERYQQRLQRPRDVKWSIIAHSAFDGTRARQDESKRILSRLNSRDFVIVLDERGKLLDSPALAQSIDQAFADSRPLVFIIGGAYGVTDEVRERADLVWSLSPLVFPHQLVRLILVEQLYRAQEISRGGKYHHG